MTKHRNNNVGAARASTITSSLARARGGAPGEIDFFDLLRAIQRTSSDIQREIVASTR